MLTLSKNLTFSLTFLVVLFAFGLAVYTPSAMADGNTHDFWVKITEAENMVDVSYRDGMQIASGRTRAARAETGGATLFITLLITTQEIVNLGGPELGVTDADVLKRNEVLDVTDIIIDAYDVDGRSLGLITLPAETGDETADLAILSHRDPTNPGKEFLLRIDETKLTDAFVAFRGGGQTLEIHTLLFSIPKEKMNQADLAHVLAVRQDHKDGFHKNKRSDVYRLDLVDDDEGAAQYSLSPGFAATADSAVGQPGVVAVQSLRERRGFVETSEFTVRILLTEEPKGIADIIKDPTKLIAVKNGKATKIAKGETIDGPTGSGGRPPSRANGLTRTIANYTDMDGGFDGDLPHPTGRDNKFHQYFVTITPNVGHNGDVVVSINQFMDNVKPVSKMYVPLTDQQIVATTLTDEQETARDARVANETLTVMVNTAADTTSKKAVATAAYQDRQEKVFDKIANEHVLGNKLVVPAGGYLVLAKDLGKAGIQASDAKLKDKTGAELKYNTTGLTLGFPADNLDDFFRNGGTLTLSYKDIPQATDSDHDDSKGGTGDDNTGYGKANSTAYAKGTLIFSEIMWGLDGGADPETGSQYIELHNPGTAAIGIDNKEWVITVGSQPTGFTVIDTAGPPRGDNWWQVPGDSGNTAADDLHLVVLDLVSMSRVMGSADGTAAASWAASIRPSANLSGRRVGTPGADNVYDTTAIDAAAKKAADDAKRAADAAQKAADAAKASPATAADIMISEIMVASNEGRLPQWIELTNVSGGKVSLSGWTLVINNDPTDQDVVGSSISLDLGDVVVGVDAKGRNQSVLVVSKTGRSSGVGTGTGDLRADRIVDVQNQVSPGQARYMLISEKGFRISLVVPPATGGIIQNGDIVGNLGMGWELPMAEGHRSSLIRSDKDADMVGTAAADWRLASATNQDGAYRVTYYGQASDAGTPGYDAGGALPVELSMFYPARDRLTGAVVIKWETQSELNNAGFFVKRSEAKKGNFVVINPTMIPGAGTTSEKQSYTYTDTSAKPNVVYYYQIEDVSLDGQRQVLTHGTRLRGHIGAAGKATTTWGELKSQE